MRFLVDINVKFIFQGTLNWDVDSHLGNNDLILCCACTLLNFYFSTKSEGKLTSLDQYISRMKPGQKDIFYLTGTNKEQLENSPFLEKLTKKNYEVKSFGLFSIDN